MFSQAKCCCVRPGLRLAGCWGRYANHSPARKHPGGSRGTRPRLHPSLGAPVAEEGDEAQRRRVTSPRPHSPRGAEQDSKPGLAGAPEAPIQVWDEPVRVLPGALLCHHGFRQLSRRKTSLESVTACGQSRESPEHSMWTGVLEPERPCRSPPAVRSWCRRPRGK